MKPDMPLDYALFQLDSTRTRCELWISAGGVTEKLASGLLKPFLAHLNAAQEQISSGAQSIRLQAPSVTANGRNSGAAWFSKGTMQRFVRFVSIPEVLERVSAVEAECQRLEEAINILASESGNDYHLYNSTSALVPPDIKSVDGKNSDQSGELKKQKHDYHDTTETTGDTSKRQLLRAMDGRRVMLQKEQRKALAQAVAAGFNMECMSDLVVFADCFGAMQLREACLKFMALRKKLQEYGSLIDEMELAAETVSTGLKMSRSGIILLGSKNSGEAMSAIGLSDKSSDNQRDIGGAFDDTHEKSVIASSDNQHYDNFGVNGDDIIKGRSSASNIGSFGLPDSFKRQVNVKNHIRKLSIDNLECATDYMENSEYSKRETKVDISNGEDSMKLDATDNPPGVPAKSSPLEIDKADSLFDSSMVPEKDLPSDMDTNYSTDNSTRRSARRSSSPMRRSASPFRKVQIGRSPVRRQGVVVMRSFGHISSNSEESRYTKRTDGKDSEDSESDEKCESRVDTDKERQDSKSVPRRLSVQDAINLFESKRNESTEVSLPKASRCDIRRESGESGMRTAPGKDVLKKWSGDDTGLETKPFKVHGSGENMHDDLSTKHIMSDSVHDDGDAGDKSHAMDLEKSQKLAVSARIDGDRSRTEHENKQEQLLLTKTKTRVSMQFDSADSRQQPLHNSRLQTLHAISVPPEHEKQNERRRSLATSAFHSTFHVEQAKLDSCTDNVKDSVLDDGQQTLKKTLVKGPAPSDKALRFEQKKPKHQEPGLKDHTTIYQQASAMEDTHQDEAPSYDRGYQKASPEMHPDASHLECMPPELSWKETNIPKRPNHHQVKERSKVTGCHTQHSPTLLAMDDPLEKNTGKVTVRKSWSTPSDFHLEALAKMVDNKDNEGKEHEANVVGVTGKDLKGRLYEQYRQKRDAKLRLESGSKRAEREAKMKAMQEALERRKEELSARHNAVVEDSVRTEKIQALKAGLLKTKKEKDGRKQHSEDSKSQRHTPILQESQSASSTPRIGKHVNASPNTVRKISPSSQKSSSSAVTATHSATRTVRSSSPKSTPKNSNPSGARSSQRRGSSGSQARTGENMLGRSVPSSEELRKESMKPFFGHIVESSNQEKGSTFKGLHPEEAQHTNRYSSGTEVVGFDTKGVAAPHSLVQVSESLTESQNSISSPVELQLDENSLASESVAKDMQADPTSEAVKVFLPESDKFRPESESNTVITESSLVPDAVKVKYEVESSSSSSNIMPVKSEEPDNIEEISPVFVNNSTETKHHVAIAEQSSFAKETLHPFDTASEEVSTFYSGNKTASTLEETGLRDPQEETMHTSQKSQKHFAYSDYQDSQLPVPNYSFVEPERPSVPTLHSKELWQNSKMDSYDINLARSFSSSSKALQLQDILNAEDRDSFQGSSFHASQLSITIPKDHHSSLTTTSSPSMIPRPILRNYPQTNPSLSPAMSSVKPDAAQSRKTWNSSQKSVSSNSQHTQKESSKGFKRLLKFGRKSRGSEPSTQDWIAASTSEGDEDGDESKDYVGEDDLRASGNGSRNASKHTERVSKVTDFDGVNGPGSRSFFSLSSFRSKSSESRSRS
ncbi:hypothetical protein O6H91_03G079700 [Diphasiastrum complanatum]|uniref:Uncharacterized protein n=3 Tax=Diphasiastrum complanatum TaxID=34168 RepID=A0ACC2E8E1_DIPCM|nr:hypothetical protein O6H91_03G079700 [Diphasiastrum complanatum]KAJ7562672.1 hypothetical protein O6H91_03G079700 [Diphasiastrum complanatum]